MIKIGKKGDCCGCSACEQICPVNCINMRPDSEGFLYPFVETSMCVDCHRCERVCPILNQFSPRDPKSVYAAISLDKEVRRQSSSGGIFSLLADKVLEEGGIVFGARFDEEWQVELGFAESKEDASRFRGSKYVQADPQKVFTEARDFLKQGRKVLFSGTPCQIAGLKQFLNKHYENLITVDFICHGVPSPEVWRKYLLEVRKNSIKKTAVRRFLEKVPFFFPLKNMPDITGISFREKSAGWKKYRFVLSLAKSSDEGKKSSVSSPYILKEFHYDNSFMRAFLSNLILRPSCYECHAKSGKSHSDITIADFWGIENILPNMDDDRGTSLFLVNTENGKNMFNKVKGEINIEEVEFPSALKYNPSWSDSCTNHLKRPHFFSNLGNTNKVIRRIEKELMDREEISFADRIKQIISRKFFFMLFI